MTTLVLVNILIISLLSLSVFYLFFKHLQSRQISLLDQNGVPDTLGHITNLNWKVKALLILTIILIVFSFLAPFVFTRIAVNSDFSFLQTGPIGDTIGGLMNPFVSLSGVVVTGLAFYAQYKANLLQRELFLREQEANKKQLQDQISNQEKQIAIQQFESQFYEMLKLQRDNVAEIKISGYDFEESASGMKKYEKLTEGRKVFVVMQTELENIISLYTEKNKLDKTGFGKCYYLFFSGIEAYAKRYPMEIDFISKLRKARKKHKEPNEEGVFTNSDRKIFYGRNGMNFNYKPFSGHSQILGHYFRHLYLTVKSVVNSDIVTKYDDRMKYLRILRAQLSNHEQILLFYNWLSEYGLQWENDKHRFFTEYRMIHNLWYDKLFDDEFINANVVYLRKKEVSLRKGAMFEIDE